MMQKKIIHLAVIAALAAPIAAFADNANFSFYGRADLSYDMINTGDGKTTANGATPLLGISKQVVSSNVSRFGFKGTEDIDETLSVNWQVEQQINFDDRVANTFASRNTFANVKSMTLGALLFGIHDTPYKIATGNLDPFRDSIGDRRSLLGAPAARTAVAATATAAGTAGFAGASNLGFDQRPTNILMYTTPIYSGVSASVAKVNLSETNIQDITRKNSLLSMALTYELAPFYAAVARESHKLDLTAVGAKETATRFGFGYKPESMPIEVGITYEQTDDNLGAGQVNRFGHNAYSLTGKYNMGLKAVKVAYNKAGVQGDGAAQVVNSDASQIAIGYDHGLTKRTKLYAIYTKISNGEGINYGFSQSSAAVSSSSGAFGNSPSAVSLGVYHTF